MKRSTLTALACLGTLTWFASAAEAANCRSACNQLRRVCRTEARTVRGSGDAACDAGRESCRTTCGADRNCRKGCEQARRSCRGQAHSDEKTNDGLCEIGRHACRERCSATDRPCVDACGEAVSVCFRDVKRAFDDCRSSCPNDDTRETCRATCESDFATGNEACRTGFDACLTTCSATTTTSTTSTTITLP